MVSDSTTVTTRQGNICWMVLRNPVQNGNGNCLANWSCLPVTSNFANVQVRESKDRGIQCPNGNVTTSPNPALLRTTSTSIALEWKSGFHQLVIHRNGPGVCLLFTCIFGSSEDGVKFEVVSFSTGTIIVCRNSHVWKEDNHEIWIWIWISTSQETWPRNLR